ncbi:MAG: hypothetical protein JWO53_732 [Chlamydiia bacterium]|nr:hypothetical protein [Chlamydiia bacterium]
MQINAIYVNTVQTAEDIVKKAKKTCRWMEKKVEELSNNHLSKEVADIVQRAFKCSLISIVYMNTTSRMTWVYMAFYAAIHIIHDKPLSTRTYGTLFDGMGFGEFYICIKQLASYGQTGQGLQLLDVIGSLVKANLYISIAAPYNQATQ